MVKKIFQVNAFSSLYQYDGEKWGKHTTTNQDNEIFRFIKYIFEGRSKVYRVRFISNSKSVSKKQ